MLKSARLVIWILTCLLLAVQGQAQEFELPGKAATDINPSDVIIWDAAQALRQADGRLIIGMRLSTRNNFSIYKSRLRIEGPSGYVMRMTTEPQSRMHEDPMGEGQVEVYDGGDFELEFKGDKPYTAPTVKVHVTSLGCTERICLFPFTKELEFTVYNDTAAASTPDSKLTASKIMPDQPALSPQPDPGVPAPSENVAEQASQSTLADLSTGADAEHQSSINAAPANNLSVEEHYAEALKKGSLPWLLVLLVVFLGGVATNVTPCVFPMIPITIRLLSKQGHRPLAAALVYASGIVVTYTCLGIVASLSGGVFGSLLAHPAVNITFAVIFCLLGLTMLGFGNLSKLQNLGAQMGAGNASYLNAFGMGAGAGLVAAPCTGPIMGALLTYATTLQSTSRSILLFFLYSLGFAIPYVFLGLAAHRASQYKVSPRIQVAVKIVFAAAMFALAIFYLKNTAHEALYPLQGGWRWLSLGLLSVGLALTLFIVRHSHLIHVKYSHLLPTLILGLGLFAGIQWATGADIKAQISWHKSEAEAFADAKATGKGILVDGWADWCVACKKMDQTTFSNAAVISLLQDQWVLVKLDLTELNEVNEALAEKYGMQGLPTLVMLPSDGDRSKSHTITGYVTPERLLDELHAFTGK